MKVCGINAMNFKINVNSDIKLLFYRNNPHHSPLIEHLLSLEIKYFWKYL